MGHYVYKYVYNGEIVYIGKNDTDLISRIKQHEKENKFLPYIFSDIYYITLENKVETRIMETMLINRYKPKLNIADKANGTGLAIEFTEPHWEKYEEKNFIKQNKEYKLSKKAKKIVEEKINYLWLDISYFDFFYQIKNSFCDIGDNRVALKLLCKRKDLYPICFYITDTEGNNEYSFTLIDKIVHLNKTTICYCYKEIFDLFCDNYTHIVNQHLKKIYGIIDRNNMKNVIFKIHPRILEKFDRGDYKRND